MVQFMLDAVNVDNIPANWPGRVAGYLAGAIVPTTLPALHVRFPTKKPVVIAVHRGQNANVADCERGDFNIDEIPPWVVAQRALGTDPTVYVSTSMWPQVKLACAQAHVDLPWWWEANWDGVPSISSDPKAVAKQYTNGVVPANAPNRIPGCDTSVTLDYWPGVDEKREENMPEIYLVADGPVKGYQIHDYGNGPVHIDGPESQELLNTGKVCVIPISDVTYQKEFAAYAQAAALKAAQGGVDVTQLASQITAKLGPAIAQELVAALGKALSS